MVDVDSVPGRRGHGIGRGPSIMTTSSEESGLVEVIAAITFLFLQRSEPRRHRSAPVTRSGRRCLSPRRVTSTSIYPFRRSAVVVSCHGTHGTPKSAPSQRVRRAHGRAANRKRRVVIHVAGCELLCEVRQTAKSEHGASPEAQGGRTPISESCHV